MLLTSIPYFREVIVMSFRCEHCGNQNNEIQSASTIRERGTVYTVKVLNQGDLDRQLVKAETATVMIPEFDLTIPPHRGQLTTIEGILRDTMQDLGGDQPLRRIQDPPTYEKIESLLQRLKEVVPDDDDEAAPTMKERKAEDPIKPFTVILDDPAGSSFLEFKDSMADPKWTLREYARTSEQNISLGLIKPENAEQERLTQKEGPPNPDDEDELPAEEVFVFPGICSSCGHQVDTRMKKVNIPYFKDIIIMSTNCDICGYRDNEVKSGGAISDKGRRITLKVEDAEDLSRDILKSETCGLQIPEIDLVLHAGTLGGRFTTVEGILTQVYDELNEKVFRGDSVGAADSSDNREFEIFLGRLKEVMTAAQPFTLILDDPLANSYLQNLYAPDPDPNMEVITYDRTFEQNEDLGLNDMKVEGYEPPPRTD
ncbi:zf-ZPR1-domain-containing protein [Dacryopinax primogenitus]|uniref:Zf-ZPR1-domain-containing protein n=1 Tax=Dacryopinax primogenitus (strain DJM 731) TaxID=1858805 RepID=M5GCC3_DACPD|nr:zf-ZPR1-domain-containing protein [Dacryopinax primogenitus]EJU03797.1 zf-ZPR1-domain-containing protein [Dacryopinax primogenitus]